MNLPQLIEITAQEKSPFESEPQLLGVYHWTEGLRSMHKHDDRLELNFILSGNGTRLLTDGAGKGGGTKKIMSHPVWVRGLKCRRTCAQLH